MGVGMSGGLGLSGDCRSAGLVDQLRPDSVPITRPQIPAAHITSGFALDDNAQFGARFSPVLPGGQLGQVDRLNSEATGKRQHAASWQF